VALGRAWSRKPAAQEKESIEAALRESGGRVTGPSSAAAKLSIPGIHPGIEDEVAEDQQASLPNYRSLRKSHLDTLLSEPRTHGCEINRFANIAILDFGLATDVQ